jgi:hypothetical protein
VSVFFIRDAARSPDQPLMDVGTVKPCDLYRAKLRSPKITLISVSTWLKAPVAQCQTHEDFIKIKL